MNNMTKKLQKMVQTRKREKVVSEQKKYNPYKNSKNGDSFSDYSPGSNNN